MKQYLVGAPLERVALDILGPLPITTSGNKFILVLTDYFSRWAEAYPIPNQEAETISKIFVNEFICRFGVPRQVHTDQGRQFESKLFTGICKRFNIDKTRTSPLHPQSDGMVERLNRTIEDILSKFIGKDQKDWDTHLSVAMMAYRTSVHESTGFSPSMLMFGREIELPIDLIYGPHPQTENITDCSNEYLEKLQSNIFRVHNLARDKMIASSDRQKRQYDHKINARKYSVGDAVWVFNPTKTKGKSPKLQCQWTGPFLIIEAYTDLIYKVKSSPNSRDRVLHHDRLKPFIGNFNNWLQKSKDDLDEGDSKDPAVEPETDKTNITRKSTRDTKPPERYSPYN
ncbi:unnamed protein product [Mytilus edulis]|uniref:Integrase catalytic domain-containing protein n=1 Tax=Mytilus edulis TaxID=6550 RepID=A0A8S3SFI1_MYTED|nr:unnamed protein product [Mytilus edulis]